MSRPGVDPIPVKPQNDIYTALLGIATVACAIGLIIMYFRSMALFPNGGLFGS